MLQLDRDGDVFVLRLDHGENRFRPDFLGAIGDALDQVEGAGAPAALVVTGTGKFFSNGLDLEWMMGEGKDQAAGYLPAVQRLYARTLCFPAATAAALNGHAFGAGGQWAMSFDYRVMREDRGFFCMPEVDMKAPLTPGMTAILQARLPHQTAHEVIALGKRYAAAEALERRIVDATAPEEAVVERAVALVAPLAHKADAAMSRLKREMYPRTLEVLENAKEPGDPSAVPGGLS